MSEFRIIRTKTAEDWSSLQHLQKQDFLGRWRTFDTEEVPGHVGISLAFCGDTGGWKSKWAEAYPELFNKPVRPVRSEL